MTARSSEPAVTQHLFEIKGGSLSLPILKLLSDDAEAVIQRLREKVSQAPEFFRNAPLLIDLHELPEAAEPPDFALLVAGLRECGVVPVGVRGGGEAMHQAAQNAALAILADSKHDATQHQPVAPQPPKAVEPKADPKPEPSPTITAPTKVIEHPIRSGQRIYAAGGDLIVLAQVSPGAEIMADGNIHVYSSLRGRALAGVQGNLDSRIFCLDLQPELIAIGGHYKVSEHLDDSVKGRPVQIFFRNNSLIIEDL